MWHCILTFLEESNQQLLEIIPTYNLSISVITSSIDEVFYDDVSVTWCLSCQVLVEAGTNAGFRLIREARDAILKVNSSMGNFC